MTLALKRSPVMETIETIEVTNIVDRSSFIALEKEWDTLVKTLNGQPFCWHLYVRTWLDNFAPNAQLNILIGRNYQGRLVAILPLIRKREMIYGLPVQQLVSPTNVHAYRFDLIAEDRETAGRAFFVYLSQDPSWDILRITDVPADGNAWQIYAAAQAAGFPTGVYDAQHSTYLALPASYAELSQGLNTKFKANLRRRYKRLEEKGKVSIERIVGGVELPAYLEECFKLEQSGWKGRGHTAATQTKGAYGFYRDLAQATSRQDCLSLLFLKLNDKPIAFNYGLVYHDVYSLVMTSYDETLKECSPGQLLLAETLKDSISRGLKEFDFLGCDLEWKRDWSKLVRVHSWLFIFRDSRLGRTLHKAKFQWLPAVKQLLTDCRNKLKG